MAEDQTTQQETQQQGEGGKPDEGQQQQTQTQTPPAEKTLTQVEVNAIIAREKAAWMKAADEDRKKAEMTEADRLKAEKAEAEAQAQTAVQAANERILRSEAAAWLADAGVKPERRTYALKMLDLSGIEIADDGSHSEAVKGVIGKLLADIPELKSGATAAGQTFGGGQSATPDPGQMSMAEYRKYRKTLEE